jgi:hypothetical protein
VVAGKAIIAATGLGQPFAASVGLSPNVSPIFLANVFVNFDGCAATIKCIATVALRAGNPIVLAGIHVVIIRFEPCALEALKLLAVVVKGPASL